MKHLSAAESLTHAQKRFNLSRLYILTIWFEKKLDCSFYTTLKSATAASSRNGTRIYTRRPKKRHHSEMEAFSSTSNISAKSLSNLTTKGSFGILRRS